jgi:iron(III) transport system permease protein
VGTTVLAWFRAAGDIYPVSRQGPAARLFALLPIITPPFVIGLAIILLLVRRHGVGVAVRLVRHCSVALIYCRHISGADAGFHAHRLLVLIGVVEGISPSLKRPRKLRASRWKTFTTVTLPLMRPGIANAFLIGFIESMADGQSAGAGGSWRRAVHWACLAVGGGHDQNRAAVLAVVLLGFTLLAFYAQHRWLGRRSYTTVTGKGDSGLPLPLPRRVGWLCGGTGRLAGAHGHDLRHHFRRRFCQIGGRDYTPTVQHSLTAFAVDMTERGLHFSGVA